VPTKLVIDADPGIGDALAIALALLDPDVDLLGVTAVAGRVSGQEATRNVQGLVEFLDPPKWPRFGASDESVRASGAAPGERGNVGGPHGLGDFDPQVAELHSPRESAKLLVDLVRDQPNEIVLLTLGPLTNVQLALELSPDILSRLNSIVCLAGTLTSGDVTATAEFNVHADPEAARNVLLSPATKTLVPVDVAGRSVLTFDQYDRLIGDEADSRLDQLLRDMLPFAFRANHERLGIEGVRLHEVAALASIVHPRFAEREAMCVDVETAGELTRGMTVFDRRGVNQWQTNIDTLTAIDGQGVLDYFARVVRDVRG
jgi:inosine-uridine nucleoside N-ribohydrolase